MAAPAVAEDVGASLLTAMDATPVHPLTNPASPEFQALAKKYRLDPGKMSRLMQAESNFDPRAVSKKGAQGLLQLMPATQRQYGVADPFDIPQNVEAGFRYYRDLLTQFGEDDAHALAAWNAGPEVVRRYGGVPPLTKTYGQIGKVRRQGRSGCDDA